MHITKVTIFSQITSCIYDTRQSWRPSQVTAQVPSMYRLPICCWFLLIAKLTSCSDDSSMYASPLGRPSRLYVKCTSTTSQPETYYITSYYRDINYKDFVFMWIRNMQSKTIWYKWHICRVLQSIPIFSIISITCQHDFFETEILYLVINCTSIKQPLTVCCQCTNINNKQLLTYWPTTSTNYCYLV